MVNEIIVHFGMHKTGSTSIQGYLYQQLDDSAYHYLSMGGPNQSRALITLFYDRPHTHHTHQALGFGEADTPRLRSETHAKLEHELQTAEGKKAILSAEVISQLPHASLQRMYDCLSAYTKKLTAVGYVRSPSGFMESMFQQRVKGGVGSLELARLWPGYRRRFANLEKIFGKESVHYWNFDPKAYPSQDVVQDFCQRLDVPYQASNVPRRNEALSLPALRLLYAYRRFSILGTGPEERRGDTCLIQALAGLKGEKLRFCSSLLDPLLHAEADDLKWMEERLGCALDTGFANEGDGCLRSEAELFQFSHTELSWLANALGRRMLSPNTSAEKVAKEVGYLRQRLIVNQDNNGFFQRAMRWARQA